MTSRTNLSSLAQLHSVKTARILFYNAESIRPKVETIRNSINVRTLYLYSGKFRRKCCDVSSHKHDDDMITGDHHLTGPSIKPYILLFRWMADSARHGKPVELRSRDYISNAALLEVATELEVGHVERQMRKHVRAHIFDVTVKSNIEKLLRELPLSSYGVELVAERLAGRLVEAERSNDRAERRRVRNFCDSTRQDFALLIRRKTAHHRTRQIAGVWGSDEGTWSSENDSTRVNIGELGRETELTLLDATPVADLGVFDSPVHDGRHRQPAVAFEVPNVAVSWLPVMDGVRKVRPDGSRALYQKRRSRKAGQVEFQQCCSVM